jgi:hypothetical protein
MTGSLDHLVDSEFNELTTRILEVVEHETGGNILSIEGSRRLHETMDDVIRNIKELVEG